ncbi:MAG TPA: triphosphoribosyl-dephospho-CoA synthase [Gemmatimonadaceae bacterium]|nr:triphosphoribosyl-dephospho-CoA synthase [Gemmatimonadaceae bacterium]
MTMHGASSFPLPAAAADDVASAAQLACLLEASAAKPGNVRPGVPFADADYEDFLASAAAIGPALGAAGRRALGTTVRIAVESTRRWTRSNTNLGIVLMLAPLARAALAEAGAEVPRGTLRERLRATLATTTVADAAEVYTAIRLASPGGLGTVDAEDVREEPTVTLLEAMALAADRDTIAREYTTGFAATFDLGVPALQDARRAGLAWSDAIVETYLVLLAAIPDTLIARKRGHRTAGAVSRRACAVLGAGGVRTRAGRDAIAIFDRELRDAREPKNPGTTADLVAAALFVALLAGEWHGTAAPRPGGRP